MITIKYTNGENDDFVSLCDSLDNILVEIGGQKNQQQYVAYNLLDHIHDAFVAYDEDVPVGCASFKRYDDLTAEVKRVFVLPEYRRKGISTSLMNCLEDEAHEQGYESLILETSKLLESAHKMYLNLGFEVIPNYGPYKEMDGSLCMQKVL